jgi:hypothetical protein
MYHSGLELHWFSFEFMMFYYLPVNLSSILSHFLMPWFTFLVLTCRPWQSQGRPPSSQNHLGRPPRSQRPLRMSVTTSKMRPCSSSMRTSFENCTRPTPFSASRAWGYCQRWSPVLISRYAEWSTCHLSVQLFLTTSRGWRRSSLMDTGLVHRCSMFPSPTSVGKRGMWRMWTQATGALTGHQ